MSRVWAIVVILLVQVVSAFFFVSDILSSYIGLWAGPLSWEARELLEIGAALGLVVGVGFGAVSLWQADRNRRLAEERLRRASGAFMELLNERFLEWRLTPAEADVALFALKGLSISEIAGLRGTSEGTVKAQTNAIYRKAGVTGRTQLLSLFIDDLMEDDSAIRASLVPLPPPAEPPVLPAPAETTRGPILLGRASTGK
ncbi:MAG: helix-turn-helix transcriptional regulator [Devosia sp.]|uniref:helix-turn-helix transcriptional regulator n=1 Tax=Devosia sp. TaxID=1871048 RepID=UPI0024CB43AF|nr:helix-turn-helix transcriptional regulator [Devosia sp.]UYO00375.1 MAG: helix-turn-helix transcriptional regulator [Devosia sp.]